MAEYALTPEQIVTLNAAADATLTAIQAYEQAYITTEIGGKGVLRNYLQVLTSTLPIPEGTAGQLPVEVLPNRLNAKPTDQVLSPADLNWTFPKAPFAFQVNTARRGDEIGYSVVFLLRIDGTLIQRDDEVKSGQQPVKGDWRSVENK